MMEIVQRWPALCAAALLGVLVGCASERTGIAVRSAEPIEAHVADWDARVVDDRFLLLPVRADLAKLSLGEKLGAGGPYVTSWVGLSSIGLGDQPWNYRREYLNLTVVNLATGQVCKAFDRQVALAEYGISFGDDAELRFAGRLLLVARSTDTNADGMIDEKDAVELFSFELSSGRRTLLTPAGASTRAVRFAADNVILVVSRPGRGIAVYQCDPTTGSGRYVAEDVQP